MPVSASCVFEFLQNQATFSLDRCEMTSAGFAVLRRSLRQIVLGLREADDHDARDLS